MKNGKRLMKSGALILDRRDAGEMLGVTQREFRALVRNPTFPTPVRGYPPDEEWEASDIAVFVQRLEKCAARGWKVPDCLFPFADDWATPPSAEEKALAWETRRRKLIANKRRYNR
jgi:hypothetical protein